MPSVIKGVIGGTDRRQAGLASDIVISTFQIGGAWGRDHRRRVLQAFLEPDGDLTAYAHAFTWRLAATWSFWA